MRFVLSILAVILAGCESHIVPPHTLLYTGEHQVNVWSWQPVAGEGYITRELRSGEHVTLKGGIIVKREGERVTVNGEPITRQTAVVDCKGGIRQGAFIRTFD